MAILNSATLIAVSSTPGQAEELPGDSDWKLEHDATLQLLYGRDHLYAPLGGGIAKRSAAELRLNLRLKCESGACNGTRLVLKPRTWLTNESKPEAMASQHPEALPEGYAMFSVGKAEMGLGKRLMGWGPSMLYSPTNRLFPDNGSVTPRKEIAGKPMVFAAWPFSEQGRFSMLLADPNLDALAGVRNGGTFALARSEWNWVTEQSATLGVVAGGGGGLQNYAGSYLQYGLNDAWTASVEFAGSRGYARHDAQGPLLAQDQDRWRWDGTLGLRYGTSSGAEIGLELIHNGYAMTPQELANPAIAAAPASGNRAVHPFVQARYALLQTTWPKLFGDRRWGGTARLLRGLDMPSTDTFAELSFSPRDDATLFFGVAHSRVPNELAMSRPVPRNAYVALEIHF